MYEVAEETGASQAAHQEVFKRYMHSSKFEEFFTKYKDEEIARGETSWSNEQRLRRDVKASS